MNLTLFLQIADGVDDATWLYHLGRGEYSSWVREHIKDAGLAEELVADGVAQRVVDDLEAVEVEVEDGEGRGGVAARARDGELEVIHEERAVR